MRTRSLVATPILIAAVLVSAIVWVWLAVGLCVVLLFVIARFSPEEWTVLQEGFGRYNEPPLSRAADCTVGVVRHLADAIEHRSRRHMTDAALSLLYLVLIVLPVLLIKLASHHPSLGSPLGLTIGFVVGDLVLELQNVPSRSSRYRGEPERHSPVWVTLAMLAVELTIYLVLDLTRNTSSGGLLRSVLTGFVLIAVVHAVATLTTFVAIFTDGRPLR